MSELSEARNKRLLLKKKREKNIRVLLSVLVVLLVSLFILLICMICMVLKQERITADPDGESKTEESYTPSTEPSEKEETSSAQETPEETEAESTKEAEILLPCYEDPRREVCEKFNCPGIVTGDASFVNIRSAGSTDATIIGKAMVNSAFEVLGTENGWVRILSEGNEGYISADYVLTGEEAGIVLMENCSALAFSVYPRSSVYVLPSDEADNSFIMYAENGYEVLDVVGDWVKLCTNTGLKGYIRKENVTLRYSITAPFFYESGQEISSLRRNILDYAFQWYGGAYVWGGAVLGVGVDCSAYCLRVFEHFNIELPRLSAEQATWGKKVTSIDEARPGDLLFFRGYYDNGTMSEGVGHVAIYIGNHKMIHAASEERGICVDTYNYFEPPICIRNVIGD